MLEPLNTRPLDLDLEALRSHPESAPLADTRLGIPLPIERGKFRWQTPYGKQIKVPRPLLYLFWPSHLKEK